MSIVNEKFEIYDYENYNDVIEHGMWAYKFKIMLPDWLPQSHLCYDTDEKPGKNKYQQLKILKLVYNLTARVEAISPNKKPTEDPLLVNNLISKRKFNIITPNFIGKENIILENTFKL